MPRVKCINKKCEKFDKIETANLARSVYDKSSQEFKPVFPLCEKCLYPMDTIREEGFPKVRNSSQTLWQKSNVGTIY